MSSPSEKAGEKPRPKLRPLDQAAILLMSLGEQDAAEILKHMGPKEVQRIGGAMSQLNNVQQSDVQSVERRDLSPRVGGSAGRGRGRSAVRRSRRPVGSALLRRISFC